MSTAVKEFQGGTELVLGWDEGNLYIDSPVNGDEDGHGLMEALDEAMKQGLIPISPEEMGEYEEVVDDCLRIWLTPIEGMEIDGWL